LNFKSPKKPEPEAFNPSPKKSGPTHLYVLKTSSRRQIDRRHHQSFLTRVHFLPNRFKFAAKGVLPRAIPFFKQVRKVSITRSAGTGIQHMSKR
jgi:hypothetical protein